MGPREGELVSERTCLSGSWRVNGKRFERSGEMDTAQYKNLLYKKCPSVSAWFIYHMVMTHIYNFYREVTDWRTS